jgi:hypothetical protein
MKITKTANNKSKITLSQKEWENIGKKAGWMKKAQFGIDIETVDIGSTPCDEPCAQVGTNNYRQLAMMEVKAFAKQCLRMFPNKPIGAKFVITNNPHDFGTYYDLGVKFNMDDEEAENYAYEVQNGMPSNWDEQARAELEQQGYFQQLDGNKEDNFEGTEDNLNNSDVM